MPFRVLYELRVVDRFRPQRWRGSAPYHWVLDAAGAAVIAAEREVDVATLTWRRDRPLALQASTSLAHRGRDQRLLHRAHPRGTRPSGPAARGLVAGVAVRGGVGRRGWHVSRATRTPRWWPREVPTS